MMSIFYSDDGEFERQREQRVKNALKCSADPGTVDGGRWVIILGLQSETGKKLNGKCGQIVGDLTEDGRYPVLVEGSSKKKAIKSDKLQDVPQEDLVQVVRLAASGECDVPGGTWRVLLFPRSHSMFSRHGMQGNAPALAMCGVPIVVEQTQHRGSRKLRERPDYDCQFATWLMIDPKSGFAPDKWQSWVGPVVVYRPGGLDFGSDDINVLTQWVSTLLDYYSEPGFDYTKWLTPKRFQKFKEDWIEDKRENISPMFPQSLHI